MDMPFSSNFNKMDFSSLPKNFKGVRFPVPSGPKLPVAAPAPAPVPAPQVPQPATDGATPSLNLVPPLITDPIKPPTQVNTSRPGPGFLDDGFSTVKPPKPSIPAVVAPPLPPAPVQTVPTAGSLPAQVADAAAAQSQLLTNPGGGASNPYLNLGINAVQGMNQLDPAAQMLQNQLFSQAFNTGGNPVIQQALGATNNSFTASPYSQEYLENLFRGDATSQPGVEGSLAAVKRQVNRQLAEQTIPGVQDQALNAGQFGSSRQGVSEGIARRGAQDSIADSTARITLQAAEQQRAQQQQVMDTMMGLSSARNLQSGNILSNAFGTGLGAAGSALQGQQSANVTQGGTGGQLAGQAFGNTLDAQLRALGLAPNTANLGMLPSQLVGSVGDAQQQHQQALIDEALARFYQYQGSNNANIQEYLANLGVVTNLSGSQTTGPGTGPSKGQSALGGAAAGAAIGTEIYPGYGTAIGAVAGGLLGAAGS